MHHSNFYLLYFREMDASVNIKHEGAEGGVFNFFFCMRSRKLEAVRTVLVTVLKRLCIVSL